MQNQITDQQQRLIMTTSLKESIELLQMNQIELEAFINQKAVDNPVIDIIESENRALEHFRKQYIWMRSRPASFSEKRTDPDNKFDPLNYVPTNSETESLTFYLKDQLYRLVLDLDTTQTALQIIEHLDHKGFLSRDDKEALVYDLAVSAEQFQKALNAIQSLEPAGVGAENTRDCLVLQAKRLSDNDQIPFRILTECFDDFLHNKLASIAKTLNVPGKCISHAINRIKEFTLDPASGFDSGETAQYITPDAFIVVYNNQCILVFNDSFQPEIGINPYYESLFRSTDDKETKNYLREKLREAYALQSELQHRKETFKNCVELILSIQEQYFLNEKRELIPMTQQSLAEQLGVHESTLSRTIRGKYIQCAFGTFPLKHFFTRAIPSGEISVQTIKRKIKAIIEMEDPEKPIPDQKISDRLAEEGYEISRRAIAKYRYEMGIPNTSERRL